MSRLDEIRKKLREQIQEETDQSLASLRKSTPSPTGTANRGSFMSRRDVSRNEEADLPGASSPEASSPLAASWQPNKRALFIGNNAYHPQNPLSKCVNDAREMQKLFADIRYRLVFDFDLNQSAMRKTFDRFKEDIEPGDELVISFSGHGLQINSELYLLPTDTPVTRSPLDFFNSCINLHQEIDEMFDRGAKMVLAIVDACRSQMRIDYNELFKEGVDAGMEVADALPSSEKGFSKHARRDPLDPRAGARGRGIVFATSHNTSALEYRNMEHGIFTHFFLEEARVPGQTIQAVIERVRQKVAQFTENEQTPSFHNDLNGDFYFLP